MLCSWVGLMTMIYRDSRRTKIAPLNAALVRTDEELLHCFTRLPYCVPLFEIDFVGYAIPLVADDELDKSVSYIGLP
jgi:hypothetical protein